jgi:CubicO group peptidase (beta-lactamase class C family)
VSEAAPDRLAAFLDRRVSEGWMPGAVWWVRSGPRTLSRGATGDAALGRPYDLASLTKPLATGLLLALLEQEGSLGLDEPAAARLGELRGSPYGERSLLDLAAHTAGLPAWRPIYLTASSPETYLERIAAEPPAASPGVTLYSDLGYIALGILLERVTGVRLSGLFEERIAAPLGLADCGFAVDAKRFRHAAPTERGNEHERGLAGAEGATHAWRREIPPGQVHDANAHALGGAAGHAGLFGTAEDVVRVTGAMAEGDALGLAGPARRRLLSEAVSGSGRTVGMVLGGHSRAARGILPDDAPGHTGFTGTSLWYDPRRRRISVLLTNRVHPRVQGRDFQLLRRAFHRLAARPHG